MSLASDVKSPNPWPMEVVCGTHQPQRPHRARMGDKMLLCPIYLVQHEYKIYLNTFTISLSLSSTCGLGGNLGLSLMRSHTRLGIIPGPTL